VEARPEPVDEGEPVVLRDVAADEEELSLPASGNDDHAPAGDWKILF
jgi:hypothetical protein